MRAATVRKIPWVSRHDASTIVITGFRNSVTTRFRNSVKTALMP